jgi:hypothetical protein
MHVVQSPPKFKEGLVRNKAEKVPLKIRNIGNFKTLCKNEKHLGDLQC